ncbi:MAG: T9SS type A sorting domain-containing protein [Bacteroidetes bacterium]|nr:T9SS type A sorting domain-containing protein [Bacteroidota bacterium]
MRKLLTILFLLPFVLKAQIGGERFVPSTSYPGFQSVSDSLNLHGVAIGGVTFIIAGDAVFNESPITFTASGTQNSTVLITWNGQGLKPVINFSGTAAAIDAGITLRGSDYFTIDGLDIRNPEDNIEYGILITNLTATNGAHYNTIKNVNITLNKLNPFQTEGVKVLPTNVATSFEGNNHYNKFFNNVIQNVTIGYSFDGLNSNTQLMCVGNEVGTENGGVSLISDIVMAGVLIDDQNGFSLRNTTIENLTRIGTGTTAPAGVSTLSGNPSEPLSNDFYFQNNTINNASSSFTSVYGLYFSARKATYFINNNTVKNIKSTGGGGNTADGIVVLGTDIIANIYNNMISDIAAPASAISGNAASRGINVRTYSEAYVFYNSVFLEFEATNLSHQSAAFIVYNNGDPVQMRNNIFVNKTTFPEGATGVGAAFYKRTPALTNIVGGSDNNIYFAGDPSPNNVIFYGHNSTAPAVDQTLDAYKARAVTFDQNSYSEDVPFMSNTDLHINPLSETVARGNALPVTSPFTVNFDFDGSPRDVSNPDIGADEIANAFPGFGSNPNPADGEENVEVDLGVLIWSYIPNPEFVNPASFTVYVNDNPDFTGVEPHATVEWISGVEEYAALIFELDYETNYFWKVVPTADVVGGAEPSEVPVWQFSTEMLVFPFPNVSGNPNPAGTELVSIELTQLAWQHIDLINYASPAGFKVYIGTNENLTQADFLSWVPFTSGQLDYAASLTAFTLQYATTYFWKVVPTVDQNAGPDAQGVVVWSFTTELIPYPNNATNPVPANGGVLSIENAQLGWTFVSNPNHTLPAGFKVYIGSNEVLTEDDFLTWVPFTAGQLDYAASLTSVTLQYATTYYWKVVPTVNQNSGPDAEGVVVWSFTTTAIPYPNTAVNPDPEDGGILTFFETGGDIILGWEFVPNPDFALPTAFNVYLGEDTTSTAFSIPVAIVPFNQNTTNYLYEVTDIYLFNLLDGATNYWKIVPTVNETGGPEAINQPIWSFVFDIIEGLDLTTFNKIKVYPNPTKDILNIDFGNENIQNVTLVQSAGKELKTYIMNDKISKIDLSDFESGIYFLKIKTSSSTIIKKIVIE